MAQVSLPELATRVLNYQDQLIAWFTGSSLDNDLYKRIRADLITNPAYEGKVPSFIRRCRDTGSLWSFAKSVDPSWEPRRKFLRTEFEPLLDYLESDDSRPPRPLHPAYDSSAWTGVQGPTHQAQAIKTLIPLAQAAVETLITHLEQPRHNGGPPLDEVSDAIEQLKLLHQGLDRLLAAVENNQLSELLGEGLPLEIARYARRSARAIRHDPLPYAVSGLLLATLTACGLPGLGGFLSGVAANMRKSDP